MPSDRGSRFAAADWATLLRQIGGQIQTLAQADFLRDDPEAQFLLRAMTLSEDMEELDRATDRLAEYLSAKRDLLARLEAHSKGLPPPPPGRPMGQLSLGAAETRRISSAGPSGEDFALDRRDTPGPDPVRRARLRL